jgi:hypothetical protein
MKHLKKSPMPLNFFRVSLSTLVISLALLVLAACGEAKSNNAPSATPTSGNSTVATASLTPTIEISATLAPTFTATVAPTSTPVPTPTPVPQPNSLIFGNEDIPWAEITRYQSDSSTKLEDVKLSPVVASSLLPLIGSAPKLASISGSSNLYRLEFRPELSKAILSGSAQQMPSLEGGMRAIVRDPVSKKIIGHGSLIPVASLTNPATAVFTVVSVIAGLQFMEQINKQYEMINKNLTDIKNFLQEKELSSLTGNIRYIDGIRTALNQQSVAPSELERYRNQLESIEREMLQSTDLFKKLVATPALELEQLDFKKKNLFVFRDEDTIKKLQQELDDFKQQSTGYLLAIATRGLSAQVSCAVPESRQIALNRIQNASSDLEEWLTTQKKFYNTLDQKTADMDGLFADSKKPAEFKNLAKKGLEDATNLYNDVKASFDDTTQKVKAQIQNLDKPLTLVVELDDQGNIKKVNKLLPV